jgi:hypothetical protein
MRRVVTAGQIEAREPGVRSRLGASLLAAGAVVLLLVVAPAHTRAAGDTVHFLDENPLSISVEHGRETAFTVHLLVSSAAAVDVNLFGFEASGPPGAPMLGLEPRPGPGGGIEAGRAVPPGIWTPSLTIGSASPVGHYQAHLVATAADGTYDSLDVTLVVVSNGSAVAEFGPQLPATVTLTAERTGLQWLGLPSLVRPASLHLSPSAQVTGAGPLIDKAGDVVAVEKSSDGLSISDAPAAGHYVGVISSIDIDGQLAATPLEVDIKDALLWPSLILLLGLGLALAAENWFTFRAPLLDLQARLAELRERSGRLATAEEAAIRQAVAWPAPSRDAVRLYQAGPAPSGLLASATTYATKDFQDLPAADVRAARWGPTGSEWLKIVASVDTQESLQWPARSVSESWARLRSALAADLGTLETSGLSAELSEAFAGRLVAQATELADIADKRSALAERLSSAAAVGEFLKYLADAVVADADRRSVRALMHRLASSPRGSVDAIKTIATEALDLQKQAASRPTSESLAQDSAVPSGASPREVLEAALVPVDGGGGYETAPFELTSAELRAALHRRSVTFSGIVGAAVFVTGLSTVYLPNATFGSLADYAAILVWGFSVTAAAQVSRVALALLTGRSRPTPNTDFA